MRKLFLILISLMLACATAACADTLFPSLTPAVQDSDAAAPDAQPDPSAALFGSSYTDMTGQAANAAAVSEAYHEPEFTYTGVTADQYRRYLEFLLEHGWDLKSTETKGTVTVSSGEHPCRFLLKYDSGTLAMVLSCMPEVPAEAETPAPAEKADEGTRICPYCDSGHCRDCGGRGCTDCTACGGSGVCGVCCGRPQKYVPGYGLGGTYVTCKGCNGSARCSFCQGTGRKTCIWCDGGICRKCSGDYMNYRR